MLIKLSCQGDQFWFFIVIKEQIKYEVSFFYLPLHSLRKKKASPEQVDNQEIEELFNST